MAELKPITSEDVQNFAISDMRNEMRYFERRSKEDLINDPKTPNSMKAVLRVNLDECEKELSRRIVSAGYDNVNNRQVINAFADKVVVYDEDGNSIVVDNWENIGQRKQWLRQKEGGVREENNQTAQAQIVVSGTSDEDDEWDD